MTEEERKNAEEVLKNAALLKEIQQENLFASRDIAQEARNIAKDLGMATIEAAAFRKAFKSTADVSRDIIINSSKILEGQVKSKDIEKEITKNKLSRKAVELEISQVLAKAGISQKDITKALNTQDGLLNLNTKNYSRLNTASAEAAILAAEQIDNTKANNDLLLKQLEIVQKQEAKLGVLGKLVKGIGKIPIIGQFLESDKILTSMREKAADVNSNKFQVMGAGIKEIGRQLNENMLDPLVMISALVGAGLTVDQRVTELERSLGVSNEEALGLENRFQAIASNSGKLAINTKEVTAAFVALNTQIGGAATTFSDELLESAAELIKLNNLSGESAARFALSAQRAGVSLESVKNESIGVVNAATQERGLRLDINKVLDQAGKITGVIAAQLGGNVVAIAEALSVAKQFGMELEAVAASGRSLLEFETSIGNELKAELLTGKQINLERARLAALTGDYKTLTREINENVGDFGDFTAMNVLQQEALAASVGMTADQLSDVLIKQADIEQLAQEARAMGKNDLADQLERRSVQEQFNDTVLKLKGIFVDIMSGPLRGFLGVIGKILEKFGNFLGMLGLGKGGFMDIAVQIGFFAVLLNKSYGTFTNIIGAMKTLKGLTLAQKTNRIAINTAEKIGLINKQAAIRARGRLTALAAAEGNTEKLNNFHKNAGLGTLIKQNVQRGISNARTKLGGILEKGKTVIMGVGNTILRAGNALKRIGNRLGLVDLFRTGGQAVLGAMKAGTKAPFPASVILPFILGGLVGAAVGAAIAKFSKADDGVFGGGGYGKRALLDEGSITLFNDKDTILAGTKLQKADDVISRPEGSVQAASPQPIQPIIMKNEVVYDSHQSANYYNGPRSTEKSETGIHT